MPCSDSSSSINLKLDSDEKFISFEFAKITCGREITAETGYSKYCVGKSIEHILQFPCNQVLTDLNLKTEEDQFILYLEWDALRTAIAKYLGNQDEDIDQERCHITSIDQTSNGNTEVALVILPPKALPKILPCSLGDK